MGNPFYFPDPDIVEIAKAHNVDPAKVALSWLVQRGIAVITKTVNIERMKSNIAVSLDIITTITRC